MGFVLRKIKKERWDKDKLYTDYPWLRPNRIPAECFEDLRARGNEISLWYVESENDPILPYICAAIAAKSKIEHVEYALFDVEVIKSARFVLHETLGDSPDETIAHLHRDLTKLTAPKLLKFLRTVWSEAITGLVLEKRIDELIGDGIRSGRLDTKKIHGSIVKKFQK